MEMRDIILDKRYGKRLSEEQIQFFVRGVTDKSIPDYQISALLMAIVLNGMDSSEMTDLTLMMASSGQTLDLSALSQRIVDKHSTGGVGDKCTPIVLPLVASFGIPVVKLSGRGLGFTGGTIDKLESIEGFRTEIPFSRFSEYVARCGAVLSAQTPELAPADKELYSLRDVTGTVESIPLIASSIMSKKIAGGADAIVLDVTCGDGAFMRDIDRARELSQAMIDIGRIAGKPVTCVITSMRQPLGHCVGNILEMHEVEEFFLGKAAEDLNTVCLTLAASMIRMSDILTTEDLSEIIDLIQRKIDSGEARKAFVSFIHSQGGQTSIDGSLIFKDKPMVRFEINAERDGYIREVLASDIGKASVLLGAGRKVKSDIIDPGAGLILRKKIGDYVRTGDCLCSLYTGEHADPGSASLNEAVGLAQKAYVIGSDEQAHPDEVIDILY